jgi:hypothetical protein
LILFQDFADNDGWFDDTADGTVEATLKFEQAGTVEVNYPILPIGAPAPGAAAGGGTMMQGGGMMQMSPHH